MSNDIVKNIKKIGLYGVADNWSQFMAHEKLFRDIINIEEEVKKERKFDRLYKSSKLPKFQPISDFDWEFPTHIDKAAVQEALELDFMKNNGNIILMGPNGVGKTMIAKNIAWQAISRGHTVLFQSTSAILNDLMSCNEIRKLELRLKYYAKFNLLVLDELGYLSYAERHADLLFQLINQRHEANSTLITTNLPFSLWNQVFPNAGCVGAMIDRLVQHGEVIHIEGDSYRLKLAQDRQKKKLNKPEPVNLDNVF